MKISRISIIVILFVALNNIVAAQSAFTEGYVVSNSGDTLFGKLKPNKYGNSPSSFTFKGERQSEPIVFDTKSVTYVSTGPFKYRSVGIHNILQYVNNDNDYGFETISFVKDSNFLEVLEVGNLSLYVLKVNGIDHFFIEKDATGLEELDFFKYRKEQNHPDKHQVTTQVYKSIEGDLIVSAYRYRSQLAALISDCRETIGDIDNLEFSEPSLRSLVRKYNVCQGNRSTYTKPKKKLGFSFGAFLGGSRSVLQFNEDIQNLSSFHQYASYQPIGGVFLLMPFSEKRDFASFYASLSLHRFIFKDVVVKLSDDVINSTSIQSTRLKLATGIQLSISKTKVQPFVRLGLSAYRRLQFEANTERSIYFLGVPNISSYNPLPEKQLRSFEFGILGTAGVQLKRFVLELSAETTSGIRISQSSTSVLSLSLGYCF